MQKGKRIFILVFMLCLLLIGSRNDVEAEAQQSVISDNVAVMGTGETERPDETEQPAESDNAVIMDTEQPEESDNAVVMETEETEQSEASEEIASSSVDNIQAEIMSGNLEHLEEEDEKRRESIESGINNDFYELEWRQIDLNGDGIDDLILQMVEPVPDTSEQRIIAIFACYEDRAECIMIDLNDFTEYSFCGITGELMYTAPNYSGVISTEYYRHYHYDSDWNEITEYTLYAYRVDGTDTEPVSTWWEKRHPDMVENGCYYRRYDEDGNNSQHVELTFDEFKEIYETDTGFEFYSDYFPD